MQLLTYRCLRINMQEIAGLESSAMENEHRHTKEAKNRYMTNRRMTNREAERGTRVFLHGKQPGGPRRHHQFPRASVLAAREDHCPIRGWRDMYCMTGPLTESRGCRNGKARRRQTGELQPKATILGEPWAAGVCSAYTDQVT